MLNNNINRMMMMMRATYVLQMWTFSSTRVTRWGHLDPQKVQMRDLKPFRIIEIPLKRDKG